MKKVILPLLLLVVSSVTVSAQVNSIKGAPLEGNSVAYALPQTAIKVTLYANKEVTVKGPYSRFAQKYLGVMAPLADKTRYTLTGADISYTQEADPSEIYALTSPDKSPVDIFVATPQGFITTPVVNSESPATYCEESELRSSERVSEISHLRSEVSFVKVPIDKRSTVEQSTESMAMDAANTIFLLRKRRMELITGEAGENVFGSGLRAALDEIDRMEQEYLSLFMGKQYTERIQRTFTVIPEKGKNSAVACRFTESSGLLPQNDLSGNPIVLEFTPDGTAQHNPMAQFNPKDPRGVVHYRIADMVECRLVDGSQELAQARLPIYQFGLVVKVPVTSLK